MANIKKFTEPTRMPGFEISNLLNDETYTDTPRPYIGYSTLGDSCKRRLWYNFRWVGNDTYDAKAARIFQAGHHIEELVVSHMRQCGFTITCQQLEVTGGFLHAKGHIDGIVSLPEQDAEMLLEIKSANQKNFDGLVKHGVKTFKPGHYTQMQAYMSKLELEHALYVAYNKNTCEYYTEIVDLNPGLTKDLDNIVMDILTSNIPLDKLSDDPDYFECKFCHLHDICHNNEDVNKNCRTCDHSSIEINGGWSCGLTGYDSSIEEQRAGCKFWLIKESLIANPNYEI